MLVEKSFDTGEVVLNYAEGPDNGPPIIFLHGVLSNWQYYQPIITHLQSRWHIYAVDHRGHGKSGHTPNQYGLEYYYNDHQRFLDNQITEPAILVGHSLGGVITCMLAYRNKEKVKAAILLDPPLFFRDRTSKNALELWSTYQKITSFTGNRRERMHHIVNLEVGFTDPPMKFVDAFDISSVMAWIQNDVDPSILDMMIESRKKQDFTAMDGWYNPETVLSAINCPVLLIQAGKGMLSLSDSDRKKTESLFKDLVYVQLMDHDHALGINRWNIADVMRPISFFLELFR